MMQPDKQSMLDWQMLKPILLGTIVELLGVTSTNLQANMDEEGKHANLLCTITEVV